MTPLLVIKNKEKNVLFKEDYMKVFVDDCHELTE